MKRKNFICLIFFLLLINYFCGQYVLAVPAYPFKITVNTTDGLSAEIFMKGDEHQKYAVTTDGYTLLNTSDGWWYAAQSEEGFAVKSNYRLLGEGNESDELKRFKATCPKGITPKYSTNEPINKVLGVRRSKPIGPIVGERRALVILIQFRDLSFKKSRHEFEAMFNALNMHDNGLNGSVRDYYRFASQGQLDYVSDIYGPFTAKNNMSYYGSEESQVVDLCVEAILSLPDTIDYSRYDNDNDKIVDNVHIVFAGYGEEAGAPSQTIWSHEYPHRIALKKEVGYSFAGYSCSPELRGNRGENISHIGAACHELGHALGAMDYYDDNYKVGGEYLGTGQWDVMANGSWNDEGRTPANFNPYVRSAIFGWNSQVVLLGDQHITMPKMIEGNASQTPVYRLDTEVEGDYFLLENRQQESFDAAIPGAGLMIYHVHPDFESYRLTNTINCTHPQGFYPVCSSYSEPSLKSYGNINSNGCPFPGNNHVRTFSSSTSPTAKAWNGSPAKLAINNITISSDSIVSFTTGNIVEPGEPDLPNKKELVYSEDFESGLNDVEIVSVEGSNVWRSYKKGNLVINGELIPTPSEGKGILMLYSPMGNNASESELIGPYIDIESLRDYTISFDICNFAVPGSLTPQFKLIIEDDYEGREYVVYSLNEIKEQWERVVLPLRFIGNHFRYKLNGNIYAGGIFIDNFCVYQNNTASVQSVSLSSGLKYKSIGKGISVESNRICHMKLYSTKGFVYYESDIIPHEPIVVRNVPRGVYILSTDDGEWNKISIR